MMHSGSQRKSVFSRLSNPPRSQSHLRSDVSVIGDSHTGCKDDEKKKRNVGSVFSRLSYGPAIVARKNDSHQRPCSDLVNKKQGTGSGYSSNCQSHSREIASSNSNADDDSRGKRSISSVMVNNSGGRAQLVVDFKHQSAAWKSKAEVPPKTKAKTQTTSAGERESFSLEDMPPKRRRKLVRPSFSLENKDEDSQPATLPASSVAAPPGTTSCVAMPAAADSPSACIAPCAVDSSSACVAQRAASPSSCVATPAPSACIAPCAADSSSACVVQRAASSSSCVATPAAADSPSHADSSSACVAHHAASPSSCVATPAAADSPSHADSSSSCVAQDAASPSSSVALTIPTSKKRPRELMEEEETRMPPKRARLSCMCVHADAALAKAQLELMKLSLGSSDEDVNKVGWSLSPSPALLSLSSSSIKDDNKVGLAPLSLCRSEEDDKEVTPLAQTTTSFSSDEDDEKVAPALLLTPTSSSCRSEEDALPQPAPVSVVITVAAHDVDDDIFTRAASILARDIIDELDLPGRYAETQKMIDRCTEIQDRIDKILWIYGY